MANPHLGPAYCPIQPMIGPPIGVEPRKATVQNDITRPRIPGSLSCCRMTFPSDKKMMEQSPTTVIAITAMASVGTAAAANMARPNTRAATGSMEAVVFRRLAEYRPPIAEPTPLAMPALQIRLPHYGT